MTYDVTILLCYRGLEALDPTEARAAALEAIGDFEAPCRTEVQRVEVRAAVFPKSEEAHTEAPFA